ncbi:hypothetical protein IEQ34_010330 [Dendrobium chrysotoxum]|uniref:Uncharacterized protein n=1 Tax=Dendrobium chrysotoxum TaxID=161865 RepID=A0AAV7H5G7_DENCH|nr:hypothetical protein IEQ34_010330 [Dendrobium chrysotoxum]
MEELGFRVRVCFEKERLEEEEDDEGEEGEERRGGKWKEMRGKIEGRRVRKKNGEGEEEGRKKKKKKKKKKKEWRKKTFTLLGGRRVAGWLESRERERESQEGDFLRKELEKLAREVGFSDARHYEITAGLMGNLVGTR